MTIIVMMIKMMMMMNERASERWRKRYVTHTTKVHTKVVRGMGGGGAGCYVQNYNNTHATKTIRTSRGEKILPMMLRASDWDLMTDDDD